MTNYHPDPQRAYESHCADGYVFPDDETGPQEATGATESDVPRVQAHGDGVGLREAVEALASQWLRLSGTAIDEEVREWTKAAGMTLLATLALHPAPTCDTRGALDETLDDLTRTLARAEKAEAEVAKVRSGAKTLGEIIDRQCRDVLDATGLHHMVDESGDGDWGAVWDHLLNLGEAKRNAEAERDRARDTAAALEAEVASLTAKVGCAERLAVQYDAGMWPEWSVGDAIRAALSDTTGEAS